MKIIEAMTKIRRYYPQAQLGASDDMRLTQAVNKLAHKPEPASYREFIQQLDELGLGIENNRVVLF